MDTQKFVLNMSEEERKLLLSPHGDAIVSSEDDQLDVLTEEPGRLVNEFFPNSEPVKRYQRARHLREDLVWEILAPDSCTRLNGRNTGSLVFLKKSPVPGDVVTVDRHHGADSWCEELRVEWPVVVEEACGENSRTGRWTSVRIRRSE
ncbi:MAG: hypothetical protein HQM09_24665 [Candidatus Riflebacteria bacterium]|nr:hypothetical protein [Candidatus Riflebacteria bacterium]